VAIDGAKGGLVYVGRGDTDLMVAGTEVDLGENGGTMKFIEKLVYGGYGEAVADGDGVEATIVNTKAPCTIFFSNYKHR